MFSSVIGYLFGGLVIGVLARMFKPGANPIGWTMTIILGILGSVVAGYLTKGYGFVSWVVAVIASIALIAIYEMIRGRSGRPVV